MGTKQEDYEVFAQRQELYTGGLSASVTTQTHHSDPTLARHETSIVINSHSLDRNTEEMFTMWTELYQG